MDIGYLREYEAKITEDTHPIEATRKQQRLRGSSSGNIQEVGLILIRSKEGL
jgi:hypothetical protein